MGIGCTTITTTRPGRGAESVSSFTPAARSYFSATGLLNVGDSIAALIGARDKTLANPTHWKLLPCLLDALDTLRHGPVRRARAAFWVDRFAHTLHQQGIAIDAESVDRTAQALQPWLGVCDPIALARGRWIDLPKSYG